MPAFRELDDHPPRVSSAMRFTTAEKVNAVLRVLKGDSIEAVSTELGVPIHRLERWQNRFVTGGSAAVANKKGFLSRVWFVKHAARLVHWVAILIVLAVVTRLLESLLQRGGGE
jgi:transposase-like protein